MEMVKLTYNYAVKKTKNYNSVEESEGFEVSPGGENPEVFAALYNAMKNACRERVDKAVEKKLAEIPEKPNPLDVAVKKKVDDELDKLMGV